MNDSDEALRKFGAQVMELVKLYHRAGKTGDRADVRAFHHQLVVVEALACVAVLQLVPVPGPGPDPAA